MPIWLFKYFPSQDGPMHLYNAHVLKNYSAPGNLFAKFYQINFILLPNVFADLILYLLSLFLPIMIGEKVFLSIYALIFPLSIIYFIKAINPESQLKIIAPLFTYNLFLLFGFYNFIISLPLFFLTLGFWFRKQNLSRPAGVILVNLLFFLTYLSHLYSSIILLLIIFLLALFKTRIFDFLKILPLVFLTIVLSLFILISGGQISHQFNPVFSPIVTRLSMLFLPVFLRYYSDIEIILALSLTLFYIIALILSFKNVLNPSQKCLVLIGLILTALFFLTPYWYGAAGYINVRIPIFIFLILTPVISIPPRTPFKSLSIIYVSIFIIGHTLHICKICTRYNKGIEELVSGISYVEPNSLFLSIIKDRHGGSKWVAPYAHAYYYYHLSTNAINPYHQDGNIPQKELEAIERLSIVQLRKEFKNLRRIDYAQPLTRQQKHLKDYDYILLWDKSSEPFFLEDYFLIHKTGHLLLYKNIKKP